MRRRLTLTPATMALAASLSLVGCPTVPAPCLWVVTNNVGTTEAPTALRGVFLRESGGEWGDNVLGTGSGVPFAESFSFLLPPETGPLDVRGVDGEGATWSQYGAQSCVDGERVETVLSADDLDVPCTWTVTNLVGDDAVNYALLDLWVRVTGTADWGPGLLAEPLGYEGMAILPVETGFTYDLSALDQDGVFFLRLRDHTCFDGEDFSSTLTLNDEAPPCRWEVTNSINGDLGPLDIVALTVTPSGTGQTTVYELTNTLSLGDVTDVPFFPRAVWDLQAIDELGQTYSYPESALCLDGGEIYALDVVWGDRDPQ